MGRREDRAALQSTWSVIEPRTAGVPIRKADHEGARPTATQVLEMLERADHHAIRLAPDEWHELGPELHLRSARPLRYDAARGLLYEV